VSDRDVQLAREFLGALAVAATTGEADAAYPLLAPDVEWLTPQRDLRSIGEVGSGWSGSRHASTSSSSSGSRSSPTSAAAGS
jgi:hypothetical protein